MRLTTHGLSVGYTLEGQGSKLAIDEFHYDREWDGWWTDELKIETRNPGISALRSAAEKVLASVAMA